MSDRIPYFDKEPEPERMRIPFSLRDLFGLIAIGCLLGGLCLWRIWLFDERVLILTWGISLAVAAHVARIFGKSSIWWPLSASVLATAIALYVVRQNAFISWRWTWSEYAWNVYRVWAVVLGAAAAAGAMVLSFVRALPHLPAAARSTVSRIRSSRRIRWVAITMAAVGVVSLVVYWSMGATRWSPYCTARWHSSSLPQVLFLPGNQEFLTLDDAGRSTLWDWDSAGPLNHHRPEAPKTDERSSFHGAVLSGNRLAMAVSANDFVTVYRLPEWKVDCKLSGEEMRSHQMSRLFSLKGGQELLVVHRSQDDGLIHFSLWNDTKQQWTRHESYHAGFGSLVHGVSLSGRYCGVVDRIDWDRTSLTVIDFETQSVIFEKEVGGYGPVFFADKDALVACGNHVFALDATVEKELPTEIVVGAIPESRRLVLAEFAPLLPRPLDKLVEEVPIVRHLGWLGRVRLVVTGADFRPQSKSGWFYGYAMTINGELSPDGRRFVWVDDQGRLLLWNIPGAADPAG
jgi:hypothetical protein